MTDRSRDDVSGGSSTPSGAASASLTSRTVRGLSWTVGTLAASALLQLVYTASISRLLEPAEFGVMAAALLTLRFITYFSQVGMASAVIQRPTLSRADQLSALRIAVISGSAGGAVVALLAPLFASLVRMPEAVDVIRWMGLSIPLSTVGGVLGGLLRRSMRFAAFGIVTVGSYLVGFLGVGLGSAIAGLGVWSLVTAHLTQATLALLLGAALVRPPLRGLGSRDAMRQLLRFGGSVSITGFLEFLTGNLHSVAVGRYIGSAGLGQYSRANLLIALPADNAVSAISRVLLPGLSQVQNEPARFAPALALSIGLQVPLAVTSAAAVAAAAPVLVPLVLGPGWGAAAAVLPVLCIGHALALMTNPIAVGAEAKGLIGRKVVIQVITTVLVAIAIAMVVVSGATLTRMAVAWTLAEAARHGLYLALVPGSLGLDRGALLRRYVVAALLAAGMALPIVGAVHLIEAGGLLRLAIGSAGGAIACCALVAAGPAKVLWSDVNSVRSRLRRAPQ